MNIFCNAHKCNFPSNHTTEGHKCGKCKNFGHGAFECGDFILIANLMSKKTTIPSYLQCNILGCQHKTNHTNEGHMCRRCLKFGHSNTTCVDMLTLGPIYNDAVTPGIHSIISRYKNNM